MLRPSTFKNSPDSTPGQPYLQIDGIRGESQDERTGSRANTKAPLDYHKIKMKDVMVSRRENRNGNTQGNKKKAIEVLSYSMSPSNPLPQNKSVKITSTTKSSTSNHNPATSAGGQLVQVEPTLTCKHGEVKKGKCECPPRTRLVRIRENYYNCTAVRTTR